MTNITAKDVLALKPQTYQEAADEWNKQHPGVFVTESQMRYWSLHGQFESPTRYGPYMFHDGMIIDGDVVSTPAK
jgi:hypothetical protein